MGFFVLCLLALSCSVLILHGKWRKQRKEESHAQCHVTQRIRIFDKISEHVQVAKSLYQRFPLHLIYKTQSITANSTTRRPLSTGIFSAKNVTHQPGFEPTTSCLPGGEIWQVEFCASGDLASRVMSNKVEFK